MKRKLVYVTAFEGLAILLSMLGFMLASRCQAGAVRRAFGPRLGGRDGLEPRLQRRFSEAGAQPGPAGPFGRRILHALGFELALPRSRAGLRRSCSGSRLSRPSCSMAA